MTVNAPIITPFKWETTAAEVVAIITLIHQTRVKRCRTTVLCHRCPNHFLSTFSSGALI
jgi:hypothetical protein